MEVEKLYDNKKFFLDEELDKAYRDKGCNFTENRISLNLVRRWLRENKGIDINVYICKNELPRKYYYDLFKNTEFKDAGWCCFDEYEEALYYALRNALKYI